MLESTDNETFVESHKEFRWATTDEQAQLDVRQASMTHAFSYEGWIEAFVDTKVSPPYVAFWYVLDKRWVLPEGDWLAHDPYLLAAAAGDWIDDQPTEE